MALVTLHSRPVRVGSKWVWRITRTGPSDPPEGRTIDITTKPGATKALTSLITDAYDAGNTVDATSIDQTENGFRAIYEQGKAMVETAITSSDLLGPRCSSLPRPKAATAARRAAIRHGRKAKSPSKPMSPKAQKAAIAAKRRRLLAAERAAGIPHKSPPKGKKHPKPKSPSRPVSPKKTSPKKKVSPKKRKAPAGGADRLAAFNAKVKSYKKAHPGVSHIDAQRAVSNGYDNGGTIPFVRSKPKTPRAATPRPATPRTVVKSKAKSKSKSEPKVATPRAATPRTVVRTPPPRPVTPRAPTPRPATPRPATPRPATPRPATPRVATPPRGGESDADKEARLGAAMDQALGSIFG